MNESPRVLELFCGIGGCAAALAGRATVAAAVDINQSALRVYTANFSHPVQTASIEWLPGSWFARQRADLWWLSPPCQPYTVRGNRRDTADPRAAPLLALLPIVREVRPRYLALENVPGFPGSESHARLRDMLDAAGYHVEEQVLCPTELGVPNRRRRFYLLAGQEPFADRPPLELTPRELRNYLDPRPEPELAAPGEWVEAYRGVLDCVDPTAEGAVAACFTSAYGKSPIRSGSYLRSADGLRRFSPREILRLLGFPSDFLLPPGLERRQLWRLVGNSLSVPAVRRVLSALPQLEFSGAALHAIYSTAVQ